MGTSKSSSSEEAFAQARETVDSFAGKAREQGERIYSEASGKVSSFASQVADGARDAKSAVGDKMSSLAGTIREKSPQKGQLRSAVTTVADGLETGATYLDKDFSEMGEDVTSLVKKYPKQALCVGIGLGFLVGSYLMSSKK